MAAVRFTKMKGKNPMVKVMKKLMSRAASALSLPFATDTMMENSMKSALTSSA